MIELAIEREWTCDRLRLRYTVALCPDCGVAHTPIRRLLAAEVDGQDWLCAAYVANDDWDSLVALDLEDEAVQDAIVHGIVLVGARWPLDAETADATAQAWENAPSWMINADTEELRGIRRWLFGIDWQKVPAALVELRREVSPFDRPVKPGAIKP